jgi:hypothetical protein
MKIMQPYEEKIKRAIRDAMAIDPLMTQTDMIQYLDRKFQRMFAPAYVRKMSQKVLEGARWEADRLSVEKRFVFSRENYRIARERLMRVMYWTPENPLPGMKAPLPMDIIEAAKAVVELDMKFLNMELANGFYKRPIAEEAAKIHYEPLPKEVRTAIISTWQNFGLLPSAAIERMVGPEQNEPITHPDTTA